MIYSGEDRDVSQDLGELQVLSLTLVINFIF